MEENNNNQNYPVVNPLTDEIEMYKNGKMPYRTYQFQLFVMCAHEVISKPSFYDISLSQINEYLRTVKFFDISEVETIIRMLVLRSNTINEANSYITKILPSVRCLHKQGKNKYYLSPCCCENLYSKLTEKKYKLKNGENYILRYLFDFQSEKMTTTRLSQEKYSNPPQYQHHINVGIAFEHHNFKDIYNKPINDKDEPVFDKNFEIPTNWYNNIFQAIQNSDIRSIRYLIYLIPSLRNFQDQNGRTVAHYAAINGNTQAIYTLKKLNADFNIFDKNGDLPIHLTKNKEILEAFVSNDCDIEALNKKGQSLLDLNSNPFNKYTIEFLIRKGFNILKPNKNGVYWAQIITKNNYFKAYVPKKDYEEFQAFLINSFSRYTMKQYKENKAFQKLISRRPDSINIGEDIRGLNEATNENDIDKITAYIAIGTPIPTECLMAAALKNDVELVRLFANNFCSPNIQNMINNVSVFWEITLKGLYDVSTVLYREYNADPNILSFSNETLMHYAYNKKMYDLVYYLLDLGASPNIDDNKGVSVQFKAFSDGNNELAENIQDYYGGDINRVRKDGYPLGHIILEKYGIERLKYLTKRGLNLELKDSSNNTVFMEAIKKSNDISALKCLIENGSDINTKDQQKYTPFYYTCTENNFCRAKFDLLLENKCDVNIDNGNHVFPISELILRKLFDEAFILLNNHYTIINDCESKQEPIVCALSVQNGQLVDKLVNYHANALNKYFPVVENYLQSSFYKFETLKKMSRYNIALGTPLQTAIRSNRRDAAVYLWQNTTDIQMRIQASKSVDNYHHTPLMLAIYNEDEYFMDQLIQPNFDMSTPDKDGKTPLIHFYEKEMKKWVERIMPLLTIEEISATDSNGCGALTYITREGNKELALELFLKGVDVFNVSFFNGILSNYCSILLERNQLRNGVVDEMYRLVKNTSIDHNDPNSRYQKLNRILKILDDAPRNELLYNMKYYENLVRENNTTVNINNNSIPESNSYSYSYSFSFSYTIPNSSF